MTYHEITKKLKDLTMTLSDWSWLDNYLKENGLAYKYREFVNAYQEREAGKLPKCDTKWGLCRYCGFGFKCGYKGFCSHQKSSKLNS